MPASARSVAITDSYRTRAGLLRRSAVAAIAALWVLDPDRLDGSFAAWLGTAERILTTTQTQTVRAADAYVAAYVSAELDRSVPPLALPPSRYAGVTGSGEAVRSVLAPTIATVKSAIAAGRPFPEAARLGQARATRTASSVVNDTTDRAVDELLEERDEVIGWRRVAAGAACGACLAAVTGAVQETARTLARHPHCRCTKEPVVAGAPDRVRRPTGAEVFAAMTPAEQAAMFAGRGGEAKAALIRSGDVAFGDLFTETRFTAPGARGGRSRSDVIVTETPLVELRRIAAGDPR